MTPQPTILTIGTGMSACGAIHQLSTEGIQPVCYDKSPYPGGHTASFEEAEGWWFDDGPHVSFTTDERIQGLFSEAVDGEYEAVSAVVDNHWKGYWFHHPVQCNLYGLPIDLVVNAIRDFIEAQQAPEGEIRNYQDWLMTAFGRTIAETFPMVYGLKYHTTEASNMSTDWLGPRLYRPSLEEVLRGALGPQSEYVHYADRFRYPKQGGFFSFAKPFLARADLKLNSALTGIDPEGKVARFSTGEAVAYDAMISSVALPELVLLIDQVPDAVREAAGRLASTNCVLVNVGVDREDLSEANWTYVYDEEMIFTRLSYPHLLSSSTVPKGKGSIQCECYYSAKYRPLDRRLEDHVAPAVADLKRCGILREDDRVLHTSTRLVPHANIIFDLERNEALKIVDDYLDHTGILRCGRYGEWGYQWTDESFKSGEAAARAALGRDGG